MPTRKMTFLYPLMGTVDEHSFADSASQASDGDDDNDYLSLAEKSDAEELIDFDGDSDDASEKENDNEEWGGINDGQTKKRRHDQSKHDEKRRRKKLRSLPTFASYEDYAKMIDDEPEDNI